ncbi:MAG: hypothetical protein ABJ275_03255 [Maricaulaceae bacterium]
MTQKEILDDIDYIKSIAEGGVQAPLVGGRIGLMWGILIAIVFTLQWAILSQALNIEEKNLFFVWIGFILIGGLGSMVLGKNMSSMAGANSVANRADNYVWVMFSAMMMTLFVGIILKMIFTGGTPALFDLMLPVGFAGQGLAYGLVAKISGFKWMRMVALVNFIVSAICFVAYGEVHIYLIGAAGIVLTVVIPSLITIKNEPNHVV